MQKLPRTSIGLDIGSRFIKLVELKATGDTIFLSRFGIKEIPQSLKTDKDKAIFQLVSQLFKENNIKTRKVNISIGGQSVFIRFVKLLQTKEEKLKQTMGFEAQNQIPFPLNEVAWDWSLLDRRKKVLKKAVIVAIKKNLVEELLSRLNDIKLSTGLIDVSPISVYICLDFNEDYDASKLGLLVDIGSKMTNLIIFKDANIWIRSFPVASDRISEVKEAIEEFIGEIERSIEYFFMQGDEEFKGEKKIDRLFLSGGGSSNPEIENRLAAKFNIKPKVLDPFRKLRISKDAFTNLKTDIAKSQLSVAVGLALRGLTDLKIEVNFLKEMLSERKKITEKNIYSRLSLVTAILIVISFSLFMRQDYSIKKAKLDKIDEMLDIYTTYEPKIKKIQLDEDILKSKIDILSQAASSRAVWLGVLKTISEILPKELWITDVSGIISLEKDSPGRLDLSGKALSYQAVNSFVSALKASPSFNDVKPISSSIETDQKTQEEIVKYSITMDVVVGEK